MLARVTDFVKNLEKLVPLPNTIPRIRAATGHPRARRLASSYMATLSAASAVCKPCSDSTRASTTLFLRVSESNEMNMEGTKLGTGDRKW